nr:ribonuclease H-like domain-containing protein [Tanacetum cinerariifolium]
MASHPPKPVLNSKQRLHLIHMDLCGPIRIASINEKRYVMVILDDYSGYTWVHFLRSNDEASEVTKTFLKRITVLLLKPELQSMTYGQISSRLDLTYASSTITTQQPTECELYLLFEAMYDDYIGGQPSATTRTISASPAPQVFQTPTSSTTIADTAPTPTNSSSQATNIPNTSPDVNDLKTQQQHVQQQNNQAPLQPKTIIDNVPNDMFDGNTFVNPFATLSTSVAKSSSS